MICASEGGSCEGEHNQGDQQRAYDEKEILLQFDPTHAVLLKLLQEPHVAELYRYRTLSVEEVNDKGQRRRPESVQHRRVGKAQSEQGYALRNLIRYTVPLLSREQFPDSGVLQCWSFGVLQTMPLLHYSIAPLLHSPNTRAFE